MKKIFLGIIVILLMTPAVLAGQSCEQVKDHFYNIADNQQSQLVEIAYYGNCTAYEVYSTSFGYIYHSSNCLDMDWYAYQHNHNTLFKTTRQTAEGCFITSYHERT